MSIWFKNYTIKDIKTKGTMVEHLGIKVIELGEDYVVGTMPVDNRTKQPFGILHGGGGGSSSGGGYSTALECGQAGNSVTYIGDAIIDTGLWAEVYVCGGKDYYYYA
mgnify:FL=1|jgi:hypothetical protein|tara:strand:+ start:288 stop:608 length:321 start_codon:yes stop_codon:yes gene_type:complete